MAGEEKQQKKSRSYTWVTFWKFNPEELVQQVNNYNTLPTTKSFRGISALLLLFSAVLTSLFIILKLELDNYAFVDVFLFLMFAFFIYKGSRFGIIGAIILWTIEKLYFLIPGLNDGGPTGNPVLQVIWWALYIHYFIGALKVENLRKINLSK